MSSLTTKKAISFTLKELLLEKPLSKKDKYYIAFGKIAQGVIFVLMIFLIVLIDRKNK